jgi:hypothetical protein
MFLDPVEGDLSRNLSPLRRRHQLDYLPVLLLLLAVTQQVDLHLVTR